MFVVTEEEAAAIRTIFHEKGEFAGCSLASGTPRRRGTAHGRSQAGGRCPSGYVGQDCALTRPAYADRDCVRERAAGLRESFRWPDETVTRSFTILTTTPNAEMAAQHDRMPVILEQQNWPVWLGEAEGEYAALLRAAPDGLLRVWPVDRRAA